MADVRLGPAGMAALLALAAMLVLPACTTSGPGEQAAAQAPAQAEPNQDMPVPGDDRMTQDPGAPPPDSGLCDATAVQASLGQQATADAVEQARKDAGAKLVRTLKPGQVVTMVYSGERLNLHLDDSGNIVRASCG